MEVGGDGGDAELSKNQIRLRACTLSKLTKFGLPSSDPKSPPSSNQQLHHTSFSTYTCERV